MGYALFLFFKLICIRIFSTPIQLKCKLGNWHAARSEPNCQIAVEKSKPHGLKTRKGGIPNWAWAVEKRLNLRGEIAEELKVKRDTLKKKLIKTQNSPLISNGGRGDIGTWSYVVLKLEKVGTYLIQYVRCWNLIYSHLWVKNWTLKPYKKQKVSLKPPKPGLTGAIWKKYVFFDVKNELLQAYKSHNEQSMRRFCNFFILPKVETYYWKTIWLLDQKFRLFWVSKN